MKRIFEDILDDIEPLQTNSATALSDDDSFWIDYTDINYNQSADDYDMSMTALINFNRTITTDDYIEELKSVIEDEFVDVCFKFIHFEIIFLFMFNIKHFV